MHVKLQVQARRWRHVCSMYSFRLLGCQYLKCLINLRKLLCLCLSVMWQLSKALL